MRCFCEGTKYILLMNYWLAFVLRAGELHVNLCLIIIDDEHNCIKYEINIIQTLTFMFPICH